VKKRPLLVAAVIVSALAISVLFVYTVVLFQNSIRLSHANELLFSAAYSGDVELAKAALDMGANVNADSDFEVGFKPIMAAAFNNHYEVAEVLVKAGANLEAKNKMGLTAADMAHSKELKRLLGRRDSE
jgi:hypothetical protein